MVVARRCRLPFRFPESCGAGARPANAASPSGLAIGDQPLPARYQPPTRSSGTQRGQQASQVNTFVKQLLAV